MPKDIVATIYQFYAIRTIDNGAYGHYSETRIYIVKPEDKVVEKIAELIFNKHYLKKGYYDKLQVFRLKGIFYNGQLLCKVPDHWDEAVHAIDIEDDFIKYKKLPDLEVENFIEQAQKTRRYKELVLTHENELARIKLEEKREREKQQEEERKKRLEEYLKLKEEFKDV